MESVSRRTRSKQDQMYRKLHEQIKIKNLGSSFKGFRESTKNNNNKNKKKNQSIDDSVDEIFDFNSSDQFQSYDEIELIDDFEMKNKAKRKKNTVQLIDIDDLVPKRKRISESNQIDLTHDDDDDDDNCDSNSAFENIPIPPPKYTFCRIEESSSSPVIKKSKEENELDTIWDDMNLYLSAIDNHDNPLDRTEIEPDTAGNCIQGGEHLFRLDEEIGLKCKFCSFVGLEIKYYTDPFSEYPIGRKQKQGGYVDQVNIFDEDLDDDDNDTQKGDNLSSRRVQGTVLEIIPDTGKDLHTHQREGFLFLWKNIGGGIELKKLKQAAEQPTGTGGCIISHAPGTGKTRLAIVFLQTYLELYPDCRPIIIAPCTMLNTWEDEFKKWRVNVPFHTLNKSSGKRFERLKSWKRKTSVLGLSYRLFEELVRDDDKKQHCKGRKKSENETVKKILLQVPGLIVLDEGHNPRNDNTLTLQALSRISTKKRIILSGTPFQNDFKELFNTLCLARPQFPDSLLKGCSNWHRYYDHDQMIDAARREWKRITSPICEVNSNERLKAASLTKVRDMISPFVHLYKGNILQKTLPGLTEAVINLKPDEFQKRCLDRLAAKNNLVGLDLEVGVSLVSVHPCLMPKKLVEKSELGGKLCGLRLNPDAGVKTKFVIQLIRRSVSLNEKVLVFSQFRSPLKLISEQLAVGLNWTVEREILEIDGTVNQDERQSRIKCFNDAKSEAKVMLATTRTCSEGINFVGASRVVLVDVVWNPQVERQAISRTYRLGQSKIVYIYHLITCGTMEEQKYCRQMKKGEMSDLVFNSWESDNQSSSSSSSSSSKFSDNKKDRILEAMLECNKVKDIVDSIVYP